MDSRVAIVGANGIGKTTFLKLLNGELPLVNYIYIYIFYIINKHNF